eukprot:500864-Pyramimonas_sp.AAC.1
MSQWHRSHAPPPPRTVYRGRIGSFAEGPSGGVHMRPRGRCRRTAHALRGPMGSFTDAGAHNAVVAAAY